MLIDEYTLLKSIGKGAFGEVYLTSKQGSSQLFATKKVSKLKADSPSIKKYFINEIQILREIKHKNIIHFETIKHTVHNYYIITEYCNGGGLSDCLKKYRSLYGHAFTEEIVQHLMRQIVDGIKYLHGRRIIHRDIKLDNILVNFENENDKNNLNMLKSTVKIIDFGFATHLGNSNLRYSTLGSPINMDPILLKKLAAKNEVSNLIGYDEKADIWSLGTVCYEMLIGQGVFNAQNMIELIHKVELGTYHVPTNLSKEVVSFLNGMLQYSAKTRLSAEELSRHFFLTKNIQEFKKIDLTKVSHKVDGKGLNINIKRNQSIWAIFKEEDEKALIDIPGNYLNESKPLSEINSKNNNPFIKANKANNTNTNNNNTNNNVLKNEPNNNTIKNNYNNNILSNNKKPENNIKLKQKSKEKGIEIDYNLLSKQQKYYRELNLKNHNHQRYANYIYNNPYVLGGGNLYNNYYTNGQQLYYKANLAQPQAIQQVGITNQNISPVQIPSQYPQYQYAYTTNPQPQYITIPQKVIIQQGYYQPIPKEIIKNSNDNNQKIQVQKGSNSPSDNKKIKNKLDNSKKSATSNNNRTLPFGSRMPQMNYNKSPEKNIKNQQNQLQPNPQSNKIEVNKYQNSKVKEKSKNIKHNINKDQNEFYLQSKTHTIDVNQNNKTNIKIKKLEPDQNQIKYEINPRYDNYTTPPDSQSQNQSKQNKYQSQTYTQNSENQKKKNLDEEPKNNLRNNYTPKDNPQKSKITKIKTIPDDNTSNRDDKNIYDNYENSKYNNKNYKNKNSSKGKIKTEDYEHFEGPKDLSENDYKLIEDYPIIDPTVNNSPPIKKKSKEKNEYDSSSDDLDGLIDFKLDDELCPEPENTDENKFNDFNNDDDNNLDLPMQKIMERTVERPTIGVPPPGTDPNDEYNFEDDDYNNGVFQSNENKKIFDNVNY